MNKIYNVFIYYIVIYQFKMFKQLHIKHLITVVNRNQNL